MKNILTFALVFISLFASSQTQYIGAPNTTVVARGNMKIDSILYLPKREKTPTDTGALRYQISDSSLYVWTGSAWRKAKNDGTVTSVGLTMPTAFAVANSPVTSAGTLAVTATGSATEYIRGDGTLGTLPTSGGGGGSGVNYYLNGSVSQGTIGGSTYYEMSKTPIVGTGTNFTASADGLMQQFITDAGDPNRLLIPAGAWNFELYFSASSGGGTPTFYVELLKYDGTTFTSISSSSASPQAISNGTTKTLYFTSLAVSETILTATDRLAIRVYVAVSGRTITFYTEDANLAEIITTFAGGVVSLNGLTANDQFFATGTSGSDFNISSTSATHTFNLPTASSTVRGALSSANWTTFNNKVNISDTAAMLTNYIRHGGYGLTKTGQALSVDTSAIATRSRVQKGIDSLGAVKQNVLTNPVTGTGVTNYVAKWGTTTSISQSQIFDNATNVGIGTASPGQKLDVIGSGRFTGTLFANNSGANIRIGGTTEAGIWTATNNVFRLGDWNTGTKKIDINLVTGNVAIGDTPTTYKLDILGSLRNTTGAAFATSSGNVLVGTTTDAGYKLDVSGSLRNTTDAYLSTASGRVGIGTTSPNTGFKLDVNGAILTAGINSTVGGTFSGGIVSINNGQTGTTPQTALTARDATAAGHAYALQIGQGLVRHISTWNAVGANMAQVFITTNSTGGQPEVLRLTHDTLVGINTNAPTQRLDINGRARVRTIDSTSSPINMLTTDVNGVIRKAAVPSGGGGSVTSITAGTGLTGGTITTSGTIAVDTASIATRARVQKGIDSVTTLANTKVSGTGIAGYFPKWTGASSQDTSQLFQLGRNIGIGTASPTYRIHLPDAGNTANQAMIAGSVFGSDGNGQTIKPNSGAITLYGQSDIGYLYGAAVSATGRWGINTRSLNDATFNVDGSVKIVTIDSTSTARNMLYQDANGVIKKSIALSMADDVMTASGSWVATKDAGSGVTINNVAYTTNGTTKMVTIDGSFYIAEASFTESSWVDVATIPSGYRPSKTVNWTNDFIVSGAEYERADNTDFTGALGWVMSQMRIKDDGTVQINADFDTNSIAAGGTAYILIQFTQSYIIK